MKMKKDGCSPGSLFIEGRCRKRGYNSHGIWNTLERTQRFEKELGNTFPQNTGLPVNTPVIWVTLNRKDCLHYILPVDEWEKIEEGGKFDKELLYGMDTIEFQEGDTVIHTDGEGGYLIARPTLKI